MKKKLKYLAWTLGSILGLLILIWIGLAVYVTAKKTSLLEKARTAIRDRVGPDSNIGDLDISLFRHFPHISLQIKNLALRDSGWQIHHHDLLTAEYASVSLDEIGSIMSGKPRIGRIYLRQGTVYLFTDSTGYNNASFLKRHPADQHKSNDESATPPDITLSDMRFVIERQDKRKYFDIGIQQLDCRIQKDGRQLTLDINTSALAKVFAFNMEKGSFIRNKSLQGHFNLMYNTGSKILQFDKVKLNIGGHPFLLSGRFFPDVHPDPFNLDIETDNIQFADATALLTPALQQKLDGYLIDRPISIKALLDAGAADNPKPLITVRLGVADNSINTPAGRFEHVSFSGSFTNEYFHGQIRNDTNSIIRLIHFNGMMQGIPLRCDTIAIANLNHPTLTCDLHSEFDLPKLNNLSGSDDIKFGKGLCKVDIRYKGPIVEKDSIPAALYGTMDIDSGFVSYLPFHLDLSDCNGRLHFDNQDVSVQKLQVRTGNSRLMVSGIAKGAVALLDPLPDNVALDLRLLSPNLDLEDLHSLAGKPSEIHTGKKSNRGIIGPPGSRLDRLLRDGAIHLQLEALDMRYKKFKGAHAKADLLFAGNEVKLQHLALEQGVGAMTASGTLIRRPGDRNPLSFKCHMGSVDISGLFAEFNNFGQKAIGDKNLRGRLTADIAMTGQMSNKGALIPNSLKGQIDFSIQNGQLLDFEPMQKIHQTVLKKRDLTEIKFAELASRLDIDTTTFTIHRMEIQSNVFTLFVEGAYDMKTGPDMSLLVPLSNLKERNADIPPSNQGNDAKAGPSLRLRARNGDDGKLKISWDPFRKALKTKGKH